MARATAHRALAEKFEFVSAQIQGLGLKLHPQSRLAWERDAFSSSQAQLRTVLPNDPLFGSALEALRDYTLFEFILESWPFDAWDADATSRLRAALKDAVDPCASGIRSSGRDTQLELYVAIALHRAGLPISLTTPDVRTRLDGKYFYVEAKRPKSYGAIEDNIRTGAGQIRDSGCPGAVFLDVSLAFNPSNEKILRPMPDDEFIEAHTLALRRGIGLLEPVLVRAIDGKPVGTVCFQNHVLRQVPGRGWQLESCCMTFRNPNASKRLSKLAHLFERTLNRAWTR